MTGGRLSEQVGGWVEFRVRGRHPERLINLAISRGAVLWRIERTGSALCARTRPKQFGLIRELSAQAGVRVRVLSRGGLPFGVKSWRRRWPLIAAMTLCLGVAGWLSTHVWFIAVVGNELLPDHAILSLAQEHGLRVGVRRTALDIDHIRRGIVLDEPLIAHVSVSVIGTRATIEVVERTPQTAHLWLQLPGDLVAEDTGQVTQVLVISGRAAVSPGDVVARGDLLVQGLAGSSEGRARGVVRADVWHEGYGEGSLIRVHDTPTGFEVVRTVIVVGPWEIIVSGRGELTFATSSIEEQRLVLANWRNPQLTVEVIRKRIRETARQWLPVSRWQAERSARSGAIAAAYRRVPPDARILETRERVVAVNRDTVGIRITLTANQDIGRFLPTKEGTIAR